jgi:hypothetical protein
MQLCCHTIEQIDLTAGEGRADVGASKIQETTGCQTPRGPPRATSCSTQYGSRPSSIAPITYILKLLMPGERIVQVTGKSYRLNQRASTTGD